MKSPIWRIDCAWAAVDHLDAVAAQEGCVAAVTDT
jgi:hypothetical protein